MTIAPFPTWQPTPQAREDALALVLDPQRAAASATGARVLAWCVLITARGGTCRQGNMRRTPS